MTKEQFIYSIFRARQQHHRFHIVTPSPWPLLASMGALMLTTGTVMVLQMYNGLSLMYLGLFIILSIMFV
jgi:ABC-type xylose transport system permease subunit